jgi:hypothetical protein
MNQATMFYGAGAITSLDHAYIDKEGDIVGGSFAIGAEITGDVEDQEQVVVDFSTCKKQMKAIIDDQDIGIDHKLVIGPWSNCITSVPGPGYTRVETPQWDIVVPDNAIHRMTIEHSFGLYDRDEFAQGVEILVNTEMRKMYPIIDVEIFCSTDVQLPHWLKKEDVSMFRYFHGLKSSTSWGCQNIAHGHLSYIHLQSDDDMEAIFLQQKIANYLDKTMFVWDQNIKDRTIQYETQRGKFSLTAVGAPKMCVFKKETTIENLVKQIAESTLFEDQLNSICADIMFMSEGLSKGAIHKFNRSIK